TRLTVWYAAVLALSLIAFAVIVYYAAANIFYSRQDELLRSTAQTVASAYVQELEEEQSTEKANDVVLAQMVFPNRYVEVADADGRVVAWSSNLAGHQLTVPAAVLSEARQDGAFVVLNQLRVAVVPLSVDRSKQIGFAIVAEPLSVVDEGLRRLRRDFLFGVPLILVLASIGGYFLARKSLSPIALMNQQTQLITAKNLSARLDVAHPRDEVGRLATTINELLARLDAVFQEQKRFITDASHELRTPLAVLRGETEVALQQERATAEYKESLALIKDEAERLSRIVENLFMLARQPVDTPSMVNEPVRLDELVADCVRAAHVLAMQKGLRLKIEGALPPVTVSGDDEMLKRMLLNLLDNSVKYTASGGEISVALRSQNGDARIVVTDTGIGIAESDQRRIFDRFYRVDKARSRALGGAGLGLSIARWIVEGHGGSLSVESVPGRGSAFTADLPLRDS
ncbi:MAG TPA: ATP-binding protein, partial [Pyrinomonadaceae bacterium]|nr:ATP-binding protein [Pyrinomonadaceae bacterium]